MPAFGPISTETANRLGGLRDLVESGKVPAVFPSTDFPALEAEGIRPIYFEGLPYRGKATRVFAFYGAPQRAAGIRLPAIVLVHGGQGTAYLDWVKLWVSRGYAAIAFDHNGTVPLGQAGVWQKHPDGGPPLNNPLGQIDWPIPDQWAYHSVADTILAHSLLASFPEIDPDRIGMTGVSWGAVIALIAAGLDPRFKCVVPVYGCGFFSYPSDDGSQFIGVNLAGEPTSRWRELWDPATYLHAIHTPMLWVNGTNDFAFTPRAHQDSYRLAPGPRTLTLRIRMDHGHNGPAESPAEIHAFTESILNGATPLARIFAQGREANRAWVEFKSTTPLRLAELVYTRDRGKWQDRFWETIPAEIDAVRQRITAHLPDGIAAWYFNLTDTRGLLVSSEMVII